MCCRENLREFDHQSVHDAADDGNEIKSIPTIFEVTLSEKVCIKNEFYAKDVCCIQSRRKMKYMQHTTIMPAVVTFSIFILFGLRLKTSFFQFYSLFVQKGTKFSFSLTSTESFFSLDLIKILLQEKLMHQLFNFTHKNQFSSNECILCH